MKSQKWILSLLSAAAVTAGCNKNDTTSQQLDKLQAKSEAAVQDMKDYTYAEKPAFVAKMQAEVAALKQDLNQLSAKIEKSSDAAKAEAKPKLEALRGQTDKLNRQLEDARNASESTWADVKASSQKAFDEVKSGLLQARQWVSDKVSP